MQIFYLFYEFKVVSPIIIPPLNRSSDLALLYAENARMPEWRDEVMEDVFGD